MVRIFSAIKDNEDQILEQLNKDIDIAKEDGTCDADQYTITASDDKIILHDKVNNEDTQIIEGENGDCTFAAVDAEGTQEEIRTYPPIDAFKNRYDNKKAQGYNYVIVKDTNANSREVGKVSVRKLTPEVLREFATIEGFYKTKEEADKALEAKSFAAVDAEGTQVPEETLELVEAKPLGEMIDEEKEFADNKGPWKIVIKYVYTGGGTRRTWHVYPKDKADELVKSGKFMKTWYRIVGGTYNTKEEAKHAMVDIKAAGKGKISNEPVKLGEMERYALRKHGLNFSEMTDDELDETVELMSVKASKVKKFSLESLKSFAKGGWRDGKLYIKMGDSDVALDLKNKVAIVIDENLSCPIDPKKSFIDNLTAIEKFMKENDLKVFSDKKYIVTFAPFKGENNVGYIEVMTKDSLDKKLNDPGNYQVYKVLGEFDNKDKAKELATKERSKIVTPSEYIRKMHNKYHSDANPTPEQEGVINFLKGFVEEHPGEAKYLVELGAKWGPDNLLEGLNHDAEGDKTESKKFSNFSPKVAKMFSEEKSTVVYLVCRKDGEQWGVKSINTNDPDNRDTESKYKKRYETKGYKVAEVHTTENSDAGRAMAQSVAEQEAEKLNSKDQLLPYAVLKLVDKDYYLDSPVKIGTKVGDELITKRLGGEKKAKVIELIANEVTARSTANYYNQQKHNYSEKFSKFSSKVAKMFGKLSYPFYAVTWSENSGDPNFEVHYVGDSNQDDRLQEYKYPVIKKFKTEIEAKEYAFERSKEESKK